MDIKPYRPPQPPRPLAPLPPPVAPEPVARLEPPKKKRRTLLVVGLIVLGALLLTAGAVAAWYFSQLQPVSADKQVMKTVTVTTGSSVDAIAKNLKEEGLIRSEFAFVIHARLTGVQNGLLAGSYRLSPGESTPEIATHLTKGQVDEFSLTFFPGATLTNISNQSEAKRTDVTSVLLKAGYEQSEITAALNKQYNHPLFASKPAAADLEGYVYGDTYRFTSGASVESILTRTFDEFYRVIQQQNLVEAYQAKGLSLYQGITLASVIQREAIGGDEAQIAQVFLLRRSIGMPLGSDVTYQYIADKTGQARSIDFDSPYNTRRYPGLPPGPISVPGIASLKAVATPANGDFIYFLSGDDNVTYFARTEAEHQANIRAHCQQKCQII